MLSEVKVQTLRNALTVSDVSEEYVLRVAQLEKLEDISEDRYIKCLAFLLRVARGEVEAPNETVQQLERENDQGGSKEKS